MGLGKLDDVIVCRGVEKLAFNGGVGKLADVTLLALGSFAYSLVAVLLAAMVGTVIAFRLNG